MNARDAADDFSLMGGPLHRLGCRLGLIRGGVNPVPLGLALGAPLWVVMIALAFACGQSDRAFSWSVVGGHVRLIIAIPLFFLCEAWLEPRLRLLVRELVRSGVVPAGQLPALGRELARVARWRDSWHAEAACLAAAFALAWLAPHVELFGASARRDPSQSGDPMSLLGLWYWFVCLTAFRFLVFRWAWRLLVYWHLLWRLSRLELRLMPSHPDGLAGLGYLEVVQAAFVPLVAAISAVVSAGLCEDLAAGTMPFEGVYPAVSMLLAGHALLFLAPLALFSPKLWRCREQGLAALGQLGARYAAGFERKWLGEPEGGEELLGTADIQSLADLATSVSIVQQMRPVAVSRRLLLALGCAALLPVLPLLFFEFPAHELAARLVQRLLGA